MVKESSKSRRGGKESELIKTSAVVPEADTGSISHSVSSDGAANVAESSTEKAIGEGCLVEVCKLQVWLFMLCNLVLLV